jgi:RHS repeat-associated protein
MPKFKLFCLTTKARIPAVNIRPLLRAASVVSILAAAASAQTGTLKVYLSPPAAQSSTVSGVTTETFDAKAAGKYTSTYTSAVGIGTYTGSTSNPFTIMAPGQYGGATDSTHTSPTNYLSVGGDSGSTSPVILKLAKPVAYFGFWWSAGDANNRVSLYSGSTLCGTFSTADLLTFLHNGNGTITAINGSTYQTSAYYGNPNAPSGRDTAEPFAYVSFVITGATIDTIYFFNTSATGSSFESDNHSVISSGSTPTIPTTFALVESSTIGHTVLDPVFTPPGGNYTAAQTVTISSATIGAWINYSTDGSTPAASGGAASPVQVPVSASETIKAIAYETGMTSSNVVTATYTITPAVPTLATVAPSSGAQGATVTVTLTGTNFTSGGTSVLVANAGIQVGTVNFVSATQVTTTFTISPTAALGATNVTVTTSGGTSAAKTFTVTAPPVPTLATVAPSSGAQGATVTVTLTGTNFISNGTTVKVVNTGITVGAVTFVSATQVTVPFTILPTAALGATNVTVTTSGGTSAAQVFTVTAPPAPTLTAVAPSSGTQGATVTVTLTGTNFISNGTTVKVVNTGITVGAVTFVSATQVTVLFTILPTAALGATNVTVTTSGGTSAAKTFTVTAPPAPTLTAVAPSSGAQGTAVTVTLTGTNFISNGTTVKVVNTGITVGAVTFVSATQVTVPFTISPTAALGATNVTATTSGGTSAAKTFTVTAPPAPTLTALAPNSGAQGGTVTVTLTGTNFISNGTTVKVVNTGIAVGVVTFVSATQVTVPFTISPTAALGATNVTVTTAGGTSAPQTFTVLPPAPTLTALTPNSGTQGTIVTVTLTGTNFVNGATVKVVNTGIPMGPVTVVSATKITVPFTISSSAPLGATSVTVTTAGGTSAPQTFTVLPPAPTLAALTPNSGTQGTSVTVTLTGTNFVNGATVSAPGITVGAVTIVSAAKITVPFTISSSAALGATNVTVTTAGGTSAPQTFTVIGPNIWAHRRAVTIDHTKVPNTDQANFPILISGQYQFLKTTTNGGDVQNANGYDIIFTSDYAGAAKLDHEIESYNPTTGAISVWVRIPLLSHTCDTVIYVVYSNGAITSSQANPAGVWDSGYKAVIHFANTAGVYSGILADSTSNQNNLNNFAGPPAGATGPYNGAAYFNGSQYLFENSPAGFPTSSAPRTLEVWVRNPQPYSELVSIGSNASNGSRYGIYWNETGWLGTETDNDGSGAQFPLDDGAWHHVVSLLPPGMSSTRDIQMYVDGVLRPDRGGSQPIVTAGDMFAIGTTAGYQGNFDLNGSISEVRVSNVARPGDWIATEFANQNAPAAFYSVSSENAIGVTVCPAAVALLGGQTQQFTAIVTNSANQAVTWSRTPVGADSVDPASGLYTAPTAIAAVQQVTVTATATAGASGSATVTLLPPTSVAYQHQRTIVIDHTKVPNTDQTNFPVLISGTFPYLASAGHGGQVQNPSGYDIIFTQDCAGSVKLDHEIESYDPVSGTVSFWVRIPILSHTTDTVIYMWYGQSGIIASQANPPGVWDTNHKAVMHFANTTGFYSGILADSTSNHNNLDNFQGTPEAALGPYNGAAFLNGSQYMWANWPTGFPTGSAPRTTEVWVRNPKSGSELVSIGNNAGPGGRFGLYWDNGMVGTETELDGTGVSFPLSDGKWHQVVSLLPPGKSSTGDIQMYIDGALRPTSGGSQTVSTAGDMFAIGAIVDYLGPWALNGLVSEVRVSNVARSADWIATEYANLSSPSTFFTVFANGTVAVSIAPPVATLLASQTRQFLATVMGSCNTSVNWSIVPSGIGILTQTGLYTAPDSVASNQVLTVTATSAADQAKSASATLILASPSPGGYLYHRTLTIDHTKIPNTDQANFPVLISGTYGFLANIANGGNVRSPNGFDIAFSLGCDPTAKLDHEIESYRASDGTVRMWVRIPSLSHTADTVIYVWYGSATVTTSQENPAGVWGSGYRGVWHLGDISTGTAKDSSGNGFNGTVQGATVGAGQIGGAASFAGGQYIDMGSMGAIPAQGTISMWVNSSRIAMQDPFTTSPLGVPCCQPAYPPPCGNSGFRVEMHDDGQFYQLTGSDATDCWINFTGPNYTKSFTTNTWHYIAASWNSQTNTETVYYDSAAPQSFYNPFWATNFTAVKVGVGWDMSRTWVGQIDEVRISPVLRSADWIAAEYANQLSPATFYAVGIENDLNVGVSPAAVTLYGGQSQQLTASVYGACNLAVTSSQAVTWTNPSGIGTLSTTGPNSAMYAAPAALGSTQTIAVSAASVADPNRSTSAAITLSPVLSLVVTSTAPPPYVAGTTQTFAVSAKNGGNVAVAGVPVKFTVTGANPYTASGVTDTNGIMQVTYTGSARGTDNLQATGPNATSVTVQAYWVQPVNPVSTTPVNAKFFAAPSWPFGCSVFNTQPTDPVAFTQSFPTLLFDPYPGLLPNNTSGVNNSTNPLTDIVLDASENTVGAIAAQGNNFQAGVGALQSFSAVFTGTFIIAQPGQYTFSLESAAGFIFGIGNGAVAVSGPSDNPLGTLTVFNKYHVMGAINDTPTGSPVPIVVSFPAAGSYPYEIDYRQGCGLPQTIALGLTQGAATNALPPLDALVLSPTSATPALNQQQSFTVTATDETGAPIADLPLDVVAANNLSSRTLTAVTNSAGQATVTYTSTSIVVDAVQATAVVSGQVLYSNRTSVSWGTAGPPQQPSQINIDVSGASVVTLPDTAIYTATATDAALTAGNPIAIAWSQTGGPATVAFSTSQQASTTVTFPAPGAYTLQVTATDALGTIMQPVGPIMVNPPPAISLGSGWIGAPADHSAVTGLVPITVVGTETLTGGTLTYYPIANPTAVTVLKSPTTGGGTLATLDTTLLPNGSYYIILQATDNAGKSLTSGVEIQVIGDYKPGRVTTSVTDLVVPAPGLPIQITRTYDSLVRGISSDFGNGWSLGINVQLDVSPQHDVTLTMNGQRRTFYFTPYMPGIQLGNMFIPNMLGVFAASFTPEPGMFGTLTLGNDGSNMLGSTGCLFDWLYPYGNSYACYDNVGTYNPSEYVYTDPYGRVYTIGGDGSLRSIQDLGGNTLTVTPSGITSTNGLNVPFTRDPLTKRITQISTPKDANHPNGMVYTYDYDANGNLGSVTYPVDPNNPSDPAAPSTIPVAHYSYDPVTHLYTGGTDPRGFPLPSTTYDTQGRLQTVTLVADASTSYTTSYAYDTTNPVTVAYPDGGTATGYATTITNPDSGTTTQIYDGYGKLLRSTDPLSQTTYNKYDANHNLTAVIDPLTHTTTYAYDSNGNRTSVTYPAPAGSVNTTSHTAYNAYSEPATTTDELGNVRTFSYDANFWPSLATDRPAGPADTLHPVVSFSFNANGTMAAKAVGYDLTATPAAATTYTYDPYGNLASETLPNDPNYPSSPPRTTTYTYDNLGRKTSMTPPSPAAATTYAYDALGHLSTVTVAGTPNRVTQYAYDPNGNKTSETDPRGNVTTYAYDQLNRLTTVTYPIVAPATTATTTQYAYDYRNNVTATIDQAGHKTQNVYDTAGRLTSVTTAADVPADARTTGYTYYDDGRKASETDPRGNLTNYAYDKAGRLTSVTAAVGTPNQTVTTYAYDDAGNQTSVTDGKNHTTQSQYDARRRLTTVTYPIVPPSATATTTQNAYDDSGNLTQVTDQAGNKVQYVYDLNNQLRSVVQLNHPDPSHRTTAYDYDSNGNLTTLTDANTHATQNQFDGLNQLSQEKMPALQTQTRQYDAAGNLTSLLDYNGRTTTYTYDAMNRLTQRTPDPALVAAEVAAGLTGDVAESFTYTATGKRATMTDASGTTTYGYDDHDRLWTKQTPQAGTLTYTYDFAGNVASMQSSNANGVSVTYTYDNMNRLQTVVDNNLQIPGGQKTTTYTYDPASNLATVTYPNGLQSTFTYDDLNRVTALNNGKASYSYTLGPTGNRQSATESSGRALNWTYDGIYRLTNETISLDPMSKNGTVAYGLDLVGNRLSQTSSIPGIPTASFSYDADDRILSTESYDANGNTLVSGSRTFTYDFANRLKSMNNGAVTLLYDGDGNRVAKTVGGVSTRYLVDDLNPTGYAQVVEEIGAGGAQRTYTYGVQRISQNQPMNGTWTPSFYGYDGLGSVRTLTNSAGAVTDTYDYDAWGNAVIVTGSTPNVYLYRGEQYDRDLNLYYLRARYFDPLTGRFLTKDPEAGSIKVPATFHRYVYAAGDPVNRIDPSGRANNVVFRFIVRFIVAPLVIGAMVIVPLAETIDCIWEMVEERRREGVEMKAAERSACIGGADGPQPNYKHVSPGKGSPQYVFEQMTLQGD